MPWVRIDEEFPHHPKVVAAGPLGLALHVSALCYCNKYLTDGFIPDAMMPMLLPLPKARATAQACVTAGLWDKVPGGWQIHDYHEYQPTKADVEATREQKREAGRKGGKAKRKPQPEHPEVDRLCNLLAELIEANGSKRPSVTKAWKDECRRLIDRDKRDPKQIETVMRWCQADSFWKSNILGMPKFRQQFDRLRLRMESDAAPQSGREPRFHESEGTVLSCEHGTPMCESCREINRRKAKSLIDSTRKDAA